jgi:predicted NBD/HSP70 family sugar kinase
MILRSEISPIHIPELDQDYLPASLWNQEFTKLGQRHGKIEIQIAITRPQGDGFLHQEVILSPQAPDSWQLNLRHLERTIKFLIWGIGGNEITIQGATEYLETLQSIYSPNGPRSFDADFVNRVFQSPLSFKDAREAGMPEIITVSQTEDSQANLQGNRIGFDLGGSDRKCAALVNGEVIFSEEVPWDPYFEKDPAYHYQGIMDSLRLAAAHLPSVDAIGGSAAGVYVDNRVRAASLFRGVSEEAFEKQVTHMFLDIAKEWNDVPIRVVNDGDVTALAGAMSLKSGNVLGLAMGTSAAAGYADHQSQITPWLSELAFVPIDYRDGAPEDEWSGDCGCAVQYFSQQGVSRLIGASGLPIDQSLSKADQLVAVQNAMAQEDDRAAAIYRSIGVYLGYSIPQFARFYSIKHLLLLGRVMSGKGGELIIQKAQEVLRDEFPELAAEIKISTPDEKMKRHGQAIAAASLPKIESPST